MASGEWPVPAAAVIQSPDATGRNQPEGVNVGRQESQPFGLLRSMELRVVQFSKLTPCALTHKLQAKTPS
jgi:hypothetical protein